MTEIPSSESVKATATGDSASGCFSLLILGGGSAGWLTAAVIAAGHGPSVKVTLVESPDLPIIGVGEGTWPSMRETLRLAGVSERTFLRECDASFKQGTKFVGWQTGNANDHYYHPFSLPRGFLEANAVPHWQEQDNDIPFAAAFSPQYAICEQGLAPKQLATPEYAAVANYAYHLDAVKLGDFLRRHCVENLGVRHISDRVREVATGKDDCIAGLLTEKHGMLSADLFLDCSGNNSILLGKHYRIPRVQRSSQLFNDRALAVQLPYIQPTDPIASATRSTALKHGWVWDIGLPTRRGMGYVYSSAHCSDEQAEAEFRQWLQEADQASESYSTIELRQLKFEPGHLQTFWHKNAVAIGMSAGFIEPLEASALVMVELSAAMIRDDLPKNPITMPIAARRFNERFSYRWERVIDFLKLHYVLSNRNDSDYWHDHRNPATLPDRLQELLTVWQHRSPSRLDFFQTEELFPAASYQYVLYGMGFRTDFGTNRRPNERDEIVEKFFAENAAQTSKMLSGLPTNRELLAQLAQQQN